MLGTTPPPVAQFIRLLTRYVRPVEVNSDPMGSVEKYPKPDVMSPDNVGTGTTGGPSATSLPALTRA